VADSRTYRYDLVAKLLAGGQMRTTRIASAFEAVPRELFVPGVALEDVYRSSEAILVKRIAGVGVSSASAPDVMACMLEQLQPQAGQRVLEIGAGTGYNAALLAHLVGHSGSVVTVDIDADLVAAAREHLSASGFGRVQVVQGDGALGYAAGAPYDRIMLTASSRDLAPAWLEQLAPGGRLLLPLALRGVQRCIAFERSGDYLVSVSVGACSFIPLRGVLGVDSVRVPLDAQGAIMIAVASESVSVEPGRVLEQLVEPLHVWCSGVETTPDEVGTSLHLWLAAHDERVCSLWAEAGMRVVPNLVGRAERYRSTFGLLEPGALAVLAWGSRGQDGFELCARAPAAAAALAEELAKHVRAWHAIGRPTDEQVQMSAYSRDHLAVPAADATVIDERWTRFVLRWNTQPPASLTL
jgi:protein-L-isoaspartate(D-aspartate) O-methyltransferase